MPGSAIRQGSPPSGGRTGSAHTIARSQETRSPELRAATRLARLWQSQKRQEADDLLAPVYGWFTEGFEAADSGKMRALLEQLQP